MSAPQPGDVGRWVIGCRSCDWRQGYALWPVAPACPYCGPTADLFAVDGTIRSSGLAEVPFVVVPQGTDPAMARTLGEIQSLPEVES